MLYTEFVWPGGKLHKLLSKVSFPKQYMKPACDGLSSNLEVDDLAAQTEADVETMLTQRLSDMDMATSSKMGRPIMNLKPVIYEVTQKTRMMIPVKEWHQN
jgi:hypothetical protein